MWVTRKSIQVWVGPRPVDKTVEKKPTKTKRKPLEHGTPGRYKQHYQDGEKPCEKCRDYFNAQAREKYRADRERLRAS